MVLYTG